MINTLFKSKHSYELDKLCVSRGLNFSKLMENASNSAFLIIDKNIISNIKNFNQKILILCGPGNNGGDGIVIANLLKNKGYEVDVSSPVTGINKMHKLQKKLFGSVIIDLLKFKDLKLNKYSLIIDSIYGVGLNRNFTNKTIEIIKEINRSKACKVSIDIASGINADTGELMPVSIEADHTVTFVAPKIGQYLLPGKINSGKVHVVSIGEKKSEILKVSRCSKIKFNVPDVWIKNFKWPLMNDHKYKRGHVLVRSGPMPSTGASRLAAISALRSGAGAVTLASKTTALKVNASHLTSVMLKEINTEDEFFNFAKQKKINTLIIGPGNGVDKKTKNIAIRAIKEEFGLILDADGLTSFEKNPKQLFDLLKKRKKRDNVILTPHEGEFNRLFNFSNMDKIEKTRKASDMTNSTILYKGNDTVISSSKKTSLIAKESSSFLSTAGSGDILAGICGGLIAQGMKSYDAAAAASWLHNEIGLEAGPGLIAEDMSNFLSKIMSNKLKSIYQKFN